MKKKSKLILAMFMVLTLITACSSSGDNKDISIQEKQEEKIIENVSKDEQEDNYSEELNQEEEVKNQEEEEDNIRDEIKNDKEKSQETKQEEKQEIKIEEKQEVKQDDEKTEEVKEEVGQGENNVQEIDLEETKFMYKDGTYTGNAQGYAGDIRLSVTISSDKIVSINIIDTADDEPYISEAKNVISSIINNNSTSVSTVSGATFSSRGIIDAVSDALSKAKNI